MGETSQSIAPASPLDIRKAYKSIFMRWYPDKNPTSHNHEAEPKFKPITETYEIITGKKKLKSFSWFGFSFTSKDNGKGRVPTGDDSTTPKAYTPQINDVGISNVISPSTSTRGRNLCLPSFSRSTRKRDGKSNSNLSNFSRSTSIKDWPVLSRSTSTRDGNPIMFSYTTVPKKSPPMEKTLECTLQDLCFGSVKKIMLTREVLAKSGIMVEEHEVLRIKVKPGWKKGTMVTFKGIGDERPGMLPSDVIFSIVEKDHPLFKREGNDLVFSLGIPLVKALTGCTLSIPLLDGKEMSCSIDEIICPGYEKIIEGQGMPTETIGKRGDLRIKFQVEFPGQLSKDQRSDISSLLQDVI